ncbi:MAG: hypothetical protein H7Y14_02280 [Burkholderiales bacterium]|nr:hypothetical protein [Burkholderiales bacterium]
MSSNSATLRWLAVVPSAGIVYVGVAFIGFALLATAQTFCPPKDVVSGNCAAPWWRHVELAIVCFSAALAAFLMVVAPALVAPSQRVLVSRGVFVFGAVIAVGGIIAGAYLEGASAIVCGLLGLYIINSRYGKHDA